MTYSQIVTKLNGSAGGTWLDLRNTGLVTVNYVRFSGVTAGNRMIVDAIGGLGAANAATLTDGARVISEDVGSGANSSHVVIDFGPQSYDFAVHYSGSISGEDALNLIQSDSDSGFHFGFEHFSFGDFITSFDYGGYVESGDGSNGNDFWSYYHGDGTNWSFADDGASSHMLTDGSYDGYVWDAAQDTAPDFAVVTTPEPVTGLAMVGVASLFLRRRRA
jgi:hypothetical protein